MTVNLLAATALLMADLGMLIPPLSIHLPALMGLGFSVLFVTNIFFAISWLFTGRKWWSIVSGVLLLCSLGGVSRTWSHGSPTAEKDHKLTLLTYNTHQCQQLRKAKKNDVLRYIRESGADIVCLQEYEVRTDPYYLTFNEAQQFLADLYPYTYFDFAIHNQRRQYGIAVFSKYPLRNKQTIPYESKANISNCCDVVVGSDTFRLFNNHLESNSFTQNDLEITEEEYTKEGMLSSATRITEKMDKALEKRAQQTQAVAEAIRQSPYPAIVCGDFNDVPTSYTYRTISHGLNDAFLQTSWCQRGYTFYKKGLGIRIDYILASPLFTPISFRIDKVDYSDHYPAIATLTW